jgi:alpha-glucosidase
MRANSKVPYGTLYFSGYIRLPAFADVPLVDMFKKIFMKSIAALLLAICASISLTAQKNYTVQSPDGKLKAVIWPGHELKFSIVHEEDTIIAPSSIALELSESEVLGKDAKVVNIKKNSVNETINPPFYKRSQIKDNYNELVIRFKAGFGVIFRAYNEGAAYRFFTTKKTGFTVKNEAANFNFKEDYPSILAYVNTKEPKSFEAQFFNSFENTYTHTPLSKFDSKRLAFLPVVVEVANGKKLCITEADLEDYPGMYLNNNDGSHSLTGVFAPYPKETKQGGHNMLQQLVQQREEYIARCKGTRNFPWRVMTVATSDKQLVDNDMVYRLASPSRVNDVSWVKPGKVAWDWWNDWNISGVDFKSGVNNETYKYYIDFAAAHKIEYVILDEGWAINKKADLMQVVPEIDIKELVDYGKQKNVGIILWAGYYAFERDMERVAKYFADLGVKGFKVDFMDRDDQQMVDFYYRAARVAAENKLVLDFHGAYKPTGLQRTYPNVLNFEGVHGLEQMKWAPIAVDEVTYDVTIPFIRMVAGPMDYTQGSMRNSTRDTYRPVNSDPMSQGTRCRQLAEYVIFESPLNMLCDNPTHYMKEPECANFIATVPKVWDNTVALDGQIAKYVAIARQKGDEWYVGALTNWDARTLELDLSFLDGSNYKMEVYRDGVNADRAASDYKREVIDLPANKKIKVRMAPGGGFAARIYR